MKKLLLIDDEALNGWTLVLESVLNKGGGMFQISSAVNVEEAIQLLDSTIYDMIFLDIRFGEIDHSKDEVVQLGGYKILEKIRSDKWKNQNFTTPVMLFTASNKIWNINSLLEAGADSYYIKESPDYKIDNLVTRKNYETFLSEITRLVEEGEKRRIIFGKQNEVIQLVNYNVKNVNIKKRIEEKLLIGYGLLFGSTTQYEKNNFLFNNEILAYVVYWSILEEVSHDYYSREKEVCKEWKLRLNEFRLQYEEDGGVKSYFPNIKDENNCLIEVENQYTAHQVKLSDQVAGILRYQLNWDHHKIRTDFMDKLNRYRNKVDFIHSSTNTILHQKLSKNKESEEGLRKCKQMLDFLIKILESSNNSHVK